MGLSWVTGLLLGFSFTRIEGPLYAVVILLLVMSIKPLEYKRTLSIVLPYTIVALFWHTTFTHQRNSKRTAQSNKPYADYWRTGWFDDTGPGQ